MSSICLKHGLWAGLLALMGGMSLLMHSAPAEAQSQQSQTSLPEDPQVRLCDQAALSGSDAQRVKECLPLVWAEDAKIRARSREVFSRAIHSINGSLHWPRKPLPRVPNPYVVEGACPGEGCRYGVFFPEQPVKLYDRPKGEPLGKQIERGERIAVITGMLYVTPVKGVVTRSHGRLQRGEAIYMLDYVGEGTSNYLVKGRVVQGLEDYCSWKVCPNIIHFDGKYSMLPEDSSQTAPQQYWWKVQRRDGSQGWLSVYDAGPLYYYTDAEIIGSPPDIPDPFDYTTQGRNFCLPKDRAFDCPNFFALLDRIKDATEREAAKVAVAEILKFFASQEMYEKLVRFGLTTETASKIVEDAIERSLLSAGADLAGGVALSIVTDAGAKAFADYVFSATMLQDLPRAWRTPLYALTESAIAEGIGLAISITEIKKKGPFVVVGPVLDRIHDLYAISVASKGVAEAQTQSLYAIALGAEITAELAAKYPSERTNTVVAQWKADTYSRLSEIAGPDDANEVRWIVELGLAAFAASHRGNEYETAQLIRDLKLIGELSDGPFLLSAEGPFDLVLKLLSGGDAPKIVTEALIRGTSLGKTARKPSPHGLEDPLTVDCAKAKSQDRNLPACPFAEPNTAAGPGVFPSGAGKTVRPILLLDRPRGKKTLGVVAADQYVVASEAHTFTVPCRVSGRTFWGRTHSAETGVYRLSYFGEGEYRYLRSTGKISDSTLQVSASEQGNCSDLYETWYQLRLENGKTGWALVSAGNYRFDEELDRWDVFWAIIGLTRHDDFDWDSLPAWTRQSRGPTGSQNTPNSEVLSAGHSDQQLHEAFGIRTFRETNLDRPLRGRKGELVRSRSCRST